MNELQNMDTPAICALPPSAGSSQCLPGMPVGVLEALVEDAGVDTSGQKMVSVQVEEEGFGYWRVRVGRGGSARPELWRVTCDYETDHVTCEKEGVGTWGPRNRLSSQTEMCSLN